jgi:hypothetical protein
MQWSNALEGSISSLEALTYERRALRDRGASAQQIKKRRKRRSCS